MALRGHPRVEFNTDSIHPRFEFHAGAATEGRPYSYTQPPPITYRDKDHDWLSLDRQKYR